ncbi:ASO-like protein [Mya arenaria]|uniref:ASO-like protein n=1 Tax=Mya arenaria TaxID=6604 RepID=A0ABY7E5R5_MYAAR|nr:ASO-like protein [Mya arenaria]
MYFRLAAFLLFAATLDAVKCQIVPKVETQPAATPADCICKITDKICQCTLVIEHKLTMILDMDKEKELIYPSNGSLYMAGRQNSGKPPLNAEQQSRVITADGQTSKLVIAINGQFPGPRIEAFVNQTVIVTLINMFHTDSISVHFHGLHQKGTPWMDGVAFITQCPILPGQTFVHRFKAYPPGTAMYHAHIGDQRSDGLYGAVVVKPLSDPEVRGYNEIIINLQDWNHLMDPETAYHRMITQQFDLQTGDVINTTYSVDRAQFSRFEFHSGLVNGKARYWFNSTVNNGSPLERFKIKAGAFYRFRIVGAMTLYPMRVYLEGQRITVRGSDGFDIERIPVQSVIVHPGERYDIVWQGPSDPGKKQIMFVAETLETSESLNFAKYHAAEAILEMVDVPGEVLLNPPKAQEEDCSRLGCLVFNCPYQFYPARTNTTCANYNDIKNDDPIREPNKILGDTVDEEYFFNFAFPGPPRNTPGSVNGREFVFPTVNLLTQPTELTTSCNDEECNREGICACTYMHKIPPNKLIQMVLMNLGTGAGWSHPIHLHGHSFYVMKMGLGTYDSTTAVLQYNNTDILCNDPFGYCSQAVWANTSWAMGRTPGLSDDPPEKDTIVVPTGGYVVIRFISDNPGLWFFHCHIDLHNTNGMGLVIDEGEVKPPPPPGFPICRSFLYNEDLKKTTTITRFAGFPVGPVGFPVGFPVGPVGFPVDSHVESSISVTLRCLEPYPNCHSHLQMGHCVLSAWMTSWSEDTNKLLKL